MKSESITDYIIRAENISNDLKEPAEVISDGLIVQKLKRITQAVSSLFSALKQNC